MFGCQQMRMTLTKKRRYIFLSIACLGAFVMHMTTQMDLKPSELDVNGTPPRPPGDVKETPPRPPGDVEETSPRTPGDVKGTPPRPPGLCVNAINSTSSGKNDDVGMERDATFKKLSVHEEKVLEKTNQQIAKQLRQYSFHPAVRTQDVSQLTPQSGGRPVINILVTSWRSGSTFMGELVSAHPATFYHYEPLADFGETRFRNGRKAKAVQRQLDQLLVCNYTQLQHYILFGKAQFWLFGSNKHLGTVCSKSRSLCEKPDFLSRFCALFPFQFMKTVRLPLNLAENILKEKKLDVRVLLLVRDPRGTMQSRRKLSWCTRSRDCRDPAALCDDLVRDYGEAVRFSHLFPGQVRVVRYEDVSLNLDQMTREIYDFFRLPFVPQVTEFLATHTKQKSGGEYSTSRDSKTTPFHWKNKLSFKEIVTIQSKCDRAMELFKYRQVHSEENLAELDPIGEFTFPG